MVFNRADAQGVRVRARDQRGHIFDRNRAITTPVDLDQRLKPVHAPARHALDRRARRHKGVGNRVGAAGERDRIV